MRAVPIFFLLLFFTGCTHTKRLWDDASYSSLNIKLHNREAIITLHDYTKLSGYSVLVRSDSTIWVGLNSDSGQVIATSEVREIEITNYERGAADGLGMGFLSGGIMGVIIGGSINRELNESFCHEYFCLLSGVAVGVPSGLLGVAIGGMMGSKVVYELDSRSPSDSLGQ